MELKSLSNWPVTRITQLQGLQKKLEEKIQNLPRHCPVVGDQKLGYHSSLHLEHRLPTPENHYLEFILDRPYMVDSIALVPAFNPLLPYGGGGAYAFPKRIKLEAELLGQQGYQEIVNWVDQDFPNPGAYPAFFNDINLRFKSLRITVPNYPNAPENNYFALGEVYIWARDDTSGRVFNVANTQAVQVRASGSYSQSSKWHLEYLTDKTTSLGFPLLEQEHAQEDLVVIPGPNEELAEEVLIQIDLGKERALSRIDLWPAKPSSDIVLPDFAFPAGIEVEVSANKTFEETIQLEPDSLGKEFGTLYSARVTATKVRYIRFKLAGMQLLDGHRVLGLGEIAVYSLDGSLIRESRVSVSGIPKRFSRKFTLLNDGYAWGRRIMPEREWLMGLAQRRPLDQQLHYINNELAIAHDYWEWLVSRMIAAAIIVSLLLMIGVVLLYQRYHRQQLLAKQSERINRDLHDEVGSSLGSITLLAEEIASYQKDPSLAGDLDDLSLMAREANISLREVVKNSGGKPSLLFDLLNSLFERAERVVRGVEIEKCLPVDCPDVNVSLSVQRHLTMFFKEVIHNCARHSSATKLIIAASIEQAHLHLTVEDNGCGFDKAATEKGWGLKNLVARAEELGGTMEVSTQQNQGVTVELIVPLSILSQAPKSAYQTSN